MNAKQQQRARARLYHAACEMWHVAAAAKAPNDEMKQRALDNAEYHRQAASNPPN